MLKPKPDITWYIDVLVSTWAFIVAGASRGEELTTCELCCMHACTYLLIPLGVFLEWQAASKRRCSMCALRHWSTSSWTAAMPA